MPVKAEQQKVGIISRVQVNHKTILLNGFISEIQGKNGIIHVNLLNTKPNSTCTCICHIKFKSLK